MTDPQTTESPTVLLRKMHRWRMAFFGLIILLAGVVIGAASVLIVTRRSLREPVPAPEFAAERMLARLKQQLNLSPKQMERLEPVIEYHIQKLNEIRAVARPRISEQLRLLNQDISTILRDDQLRVWQRHLQRLQTDLLRPRPGPGAGQGLGPERRFRGGREQSGKPSLPPDSPLVPATPPTGN